MRPVILSVVVLLALIPVNASAQEAGRAADLDPRNVEYQYSAAHKWQLAGQAIPSLPYLERIASGNR